MTLVEIRKEIPDLQAKVSEITTKRKGLTDRLASIGGDIRAVEEHIKVLTELSGKMTGKKDAQLVADQLKEAQEKKDALEQEKAEKEKELTDGNFDKEIHDARARLDEIFTTLEQDPIINEKLQDAIRFHFDVEIGTRLDEATNLQKLNDELPVALKDDSADGLKSLVEEIGKKFDERNKALNDRNVSADDLKKAQDEYFSALDALKAQIESKYNIKLESDADIAYILDYTSGKTTGDFKLPTLESKMQEIQNVVKKLEEKRDARLAELEGKKVVTTGSHTQEIEANNQKIEEERQKITDIDTRISEIDTLIPEVDNKVAETQQKIDNLNPNKTAEDELKKKHIISEEVVTDLKDENSEISKMFKQFTDADLAVRKAFERNELENTPEAMEALKKAIEEYKTIAEGLKDKSGYDVKAWQNYLKSGINDKISDGQTVDDAYFYPINRNFNKMADDQDIRRHKDEYNAVAERLDGIDVLRDGILDGNFDLSKLESTFEGYHKKVADLDKVSEIEIDGKRASIYDLMKKGGEGLIALTPFTKFKNMLKRVFTKVKQYGFGGLPSEEEKQELVDEYKGKGISEEDREKIKGLREQRGQLEDRKTQLKASRGILEIQKTDAKKNIADLETENQRLAEEDARNAAAAQTFEETANPMTQRNRMRDNDVIITSYIDEHGDDGR